MKVVILGKGLMLANIILGVKDSDGDIVGVLRYESTINSRIKMFFNDTFNPDAVYNLAKQSSIKLLNYKSANSSEFRKFLIKENVDLIIIGTWREKIEKATFDIPKIATINVHPSLLPKYRGPNPYLQTILNGEEYSGVTLHLVDELYDSGSILSQEKIKILPNYTSKELRDKTVLKARKLVSQAIIDLDSKIITPIKQNSKLSSYYKNISGNERMLDFKNMDSDEISRTIRALHPFLPTYITYKNNFFIVNPYKFEIIDKIYNNNSGDIVGKNERNSSLTIIHITFIK